MAVAIDGTNGLTFNDSTIIKSGYSGAKAWVSCSGATINSSFNVSSITYPTTGRFQINFTTAMPNANYAIVAMGAPSSEIAMCCYTGYQTLYGTNSTTVAYVTAVNIAGPVVHNPANLYVVVFGT